MSKFQIQYIVLLLFLGVINSISVGQGKSSRHVIDSLKKVLITEFDDTNKVNTLNRLSHKLDAMNIYDSALDYAQKAKALSEKVNFKNGIARALANIGNIYYDQGNYPKALEYLSKKLTMDEETGDKNGIAIELGNLASIYYAQGNYPSALEYFLKGLHVTDDIGDKQGSAINLGNIGSIYSDQGNYPKSLEYYLKALNITQQIGDSEGIAANMGNIGIIYYNQKNYSKALEYYLKALPIEQETGYKTGVAINLGNIGDVYLDQGNYRIARDYYIKAMAVAKEIEDKDDIGHITGSIGDTYYEEGNYPEALDYHFKALTIEEGIGDKREISKSYVDIGKSYTKQKNNGKAKVFIDSSLAVAQNIGDKDLLQNAYAALANMDSTMGNYKTAYGEYEQSTFYHDSLINKEDVQKISQLESGYVFEKREDSIKVVGEKKDIQKADEARRKTVVTYGMIIISLLTIILAIVLINRQQIKRKKDKLLFEKEKQHMEDELTNAKVLLDEYINNIVEKNTLLEQFKVDVEELKNLKSKEIDEKRVEYIENLNKITILTEDDWNKFKALFEQVYKGYFVRLKEKMPDITQAEMRLVCLTKLKLDTKQMAGVLGVSIETIWKSRYRLRKKFGLAEEGSIDIIAESI